MSAFKQFLSQDVIISPLKVNKGFSFSGRTNPSIGFDNSPGIEAYLAQTSSLLFNPNNISDKTGTVSGSQYRSLIYESVKHLYYSNYLSSSFGDDASLPQLIPGVDQEGDRFIGSYLSPTRENYLQTNINYPKLFNQNLGFFLVISVPSNLYGEYIVPNSFEYRVNKNTLPGNLIGEYVLRDDGEGNIILNSNSPSITVNNEVVGNIFYEHGIITVLTASLNNFQTFAGLVNVLRGEPNVTCSFSSSMTIFETQYQVNIRENEFNFSLNPSLISGSEGNIYSYATGSDFSPYITTIGLYDDNQNLLAVGKLSQPLKTDSTTDINIMINFDR
jgi:hypothetical protein